MPVLRCARDKRSEWRGNGSAGSGGPRAEPSVVVGYHASCGTEEGEGLLSECDLGLVQPLRDRLDGGRPRERGLGRPGRFADLAEARAFCQSFFAGTTRNTGTGGSRC